MRSRHPSDRRTKLKCLLDNKRVYRLTREDNLLYLAVILDAFSGRVIGWALERNLEDTLTLGALRMAIERRRPAARLVHHSDRGERYASRDYTDVLRAQQIRISMSRPGTPYDNARTESFFKTLKYKEVYRQEYRDFAEARASIQHFVEQVYNEKRLPLGLGISSSGGIRAIAHAGLRQPQAIAKSFLSSGD
ncbi:MAG: transposase [Bryobacteraceae bacterium]